MKRTLLLLFTCLMLLSWPQQAMAELQTAVFAGGCFWCLEHDLEDLPGVREAVSGYSGGQLERPTYRQVSSETTGHQEAVQVRFDSDQISYRSCCAATGAMWIPWTAAVSSVTAAIPIGR
jgi:peptide-methionine (S)-S-oxide reductase